ncbi:MAG: sulfur relay protein DsrC [Chromatiaceae bacterium]|nr:sulfur relay protein DsrC [Gammaproteobacteria bacterium]MCP5448008.1 sulfur relay protein DsrC [Chromatiaceae bacterium]MCB1861307.1 sulfur relay protein DsrC [Gammaproteobacteria bacterium]MCB1872760.1 sulfur relay protein DsrC [Gammaproteobacteria bacterium]MCB1879104.1 sulfur relay protein DsrC [Gammaproteobacteria bacterium]
MLHLSEVLMQHPEVESFEELVAKVKERSKTEMFFRIDVKPQFSDTPENWEDRLEAAFT